MNFRADTTSGEEGVALFRAIRARFPEMPVILLTAWTQLESAVELVKAGAADYLAKPWDDTKLLTTVQNLLELSVTRRELARRRADENRRKTELEHRYDLRDVVFADPAMERVIALACQVARADVPVLITGPNGAGKEKIAEIVQANSMVRTGPFVTLNCGALPSELLEAELFGAEVGAYTGATKAREGKFDSADGGTLFLDEIGNLSLNGQMKLLRVLETGRFERLGSNKERQVKVRVISATNADLDAMIRAGTFREDLYLPAQHDRAARPAAGRARRRYRPARAAFPRGRQAALDRRVRGLARAHVARQRARAQERVAARRVARHRTRSSPSRTWHCPVCRPLQKRLDRSTIEAALARASGVIAQAASELGLSRQALYRRMEKLNIPKE